MSKLPLCSSAQIVSALKRAGFKTMGKSRGSHQVFAEDQENPARRYCTVVLGKREVPRGTLKEILKQAGLSDEEFIRLLKKKRRR